MSTKHIKLIDTCKKENTTCKCFVANVENIIIKYIDLEGIQTRLIFFPNYEHGENHE